MNMARNNWLITTVVTLTLFMAGKTLALPINGKTAAGKATISTPSATEMHIVQGSNRAIINWDSFSIDKGQSVNITQPTSQSTLLNRVVGNNPSEIFGSLTANGQLFLINPGGVLFAPGSSINAGGLVASTLGIKDSDFLSEKYSFFQTGTSSSVINQGIINAGFAALLGSSVENSGTMITSKGLAGIAVGEGITLNMDPNGLVAIKVDEAAYNALIKNNGVIEARDGTVVMTATAADALLSSVVNNSGRVRAGSITENNGNVVIHSASIINSGIIEAGNKIDASAEGAMINTGKLSADDIKVSANNLIDAGFWKSGNILIHAKGSIEQTASSTITADGDNGGYISISAGKSLYLSGALSACGREFQGGEIRITAPETILAGTKVMTDGVNGGGKIFTGGGWQGNDVTLANSERTLITSGSKLTANGLVRGNGGTVVLWSNQSTSFSGTIEAKGGINDGNGGNVEVSSHDKLSFDGNVVTASPRGENGLLLLDPRNITIDSNPTVQTFSLIPLPDANPNSVNQHGSGKIIELANGNILVSSPSDDFTATDAGAVRLYRPDGTLLSMLTGSTANDMVGYTVKALAGNNNAVVSTANWTNAGQANAGSVTWIDGTTGISGNVSAINSLVGSSANDCVGSAITVLTNGNFVVSSPHWNSNTGAASWGNGATLGSRLTGTISDINSLVGSSPNDGIGTNVTVLTNGNYVVSSGFWDKVNADNTVVMNAGAVTWCDGLGGTTGAVSTSNSLFGQNKNDFTGSNDANSNNVTALLNGNYVVCSGYWDNGIALNAGAITWGNGSGGTIGAVGADNSLVGSKSGNQVGYGNGAVTVLNNGNYVVTSALWDNGTATNAGAVSWGNGNGGTVGVVSALNSLVGTTKNDYIGSDDAASNNVVALTNGNYVVSSKYWDNGTVVDAGTVCWGNGLGGTIGTINASNSLVGSSPNDRTGSVVTALSNGHYVVGSPNWNNGAGAAIWGNGESGGSRLTGEISVDNSLVGSSTNDGIGSSIIALTNGHYVVASPNWNNGAGAVTWGDGEARGTRLTRTISVDNSLIGSSANDGIGHSVTVLTKGNFVVSSGYWDKINADNSVVSDAGAVSWCSGLGGTNGIVSGSNSLIGSTKNDYAGSDDLRSNNVIALPNGNYVVSSKYWDNNSAVNAGGVTWGSGIGGTVGAISAANSLVGSRTGNQVGGVTVLPNSNYVVTSLLWDNGSATNAGAVTFGNGVKGSVGVVTSFNSMTGSAKEDQVGSGGITPLTVGYMKGCFVVSSPAWLNSAGRVDIFSPVPVTQKYTSNPGTDNTLTPEEITTLLNAGENIILNANNDITVNSDIFSSSPGSNSGNLALNAGRSILMNASISTKNGNLTLIANDYKDNGVVDAFRADGSAEITMGAGSSINTGSGSVTIELRDGAGNTNRESCNITLRDIAAGTISAVNNGITTGSGISLASGTLATNASSGSSIVLAGRNFDNSEGGTLSTSGTARWLVYSDNPGATIKGGLRSDFRHYNTSYSNYAANDVSESGNGFIYTSAAGAVSVSPTLLSGSASSIYGTTPTAAFGYTLSSSDNEDTTGNIGLTGTMILSGVPTAASSAGGYTISYGGGLSSSMGLTFTAGNGLRYTVDKRAINISAIAASKTYGDADKTLNWLAETQTGNRGLIPGDGFSGVLGRTAGENVGTFAINRGSLANSNYTINYNGSNLTINPRPITLQAMGASRVYGETDPKLAVDITTGSLGSVTVNDTLSDVTGTLTRQTGSDVGSYDIALGSGIRAGNYAVTFATDNNALSITQRPIIISADDKSKTYSISDPKLTWVAESKSSGRGLIYGDSDSFSGTLGRTAGENVGSYKITQGSLKNNNYLISLTAADLTITARPITLHATSKSKIYGEPDPNLAVSITSGTLGSVTVSDELSDITGTLTRQAGNGVGSYDISLGSGTKAGNYSITFAADNNAFSINQRPVIISADAKNKSYGESDPTLTWQSNSFGTGRGLIAGDSFSGSLERTPGENAGAYAINQGTLGNSNYKISFNDANLTIDKTTLTLSSTVTATNNDASKVKSIQLQASHDATNTVSGKEFFRTSMSIDNAPAITTRDLPIVGNSKSSPGEFSQPQKSNQTSADHDLFAVSTIEAHEPAMAFFILPIPEGTFKHNNPQAVISIEVRLLNGSSIPSWMSFDPKQKVLSGTPPQDAKGDYQVELIAKDQFGGEARTVVFVNVG